MTKSTFLVAIATSALCAAAASAHPFRLGSDQIPGGADGAASSGSARVYADGRISLTVSDIPQGVVLNRAALGAGRVHEPGVEIASFPLVQGLGRPGGGSSPQDARRIPDDSRISLALADSIIERPSDYFFNVYAEGSSEPVLRGQLPTFFRICLRGENDALVNGSLTIDAGSGEIRWSASVERLGVPSQFVLTRPDGSGAPGVTIELTPHPGAGPGSLNDSTTAPIELVDAVLLDPGAFFLVATTENASEASGRLFEAVREWDADYDCTINVNDLAFWVGQWGPAFDSADLAQLLGAWGPTP